MAITDIPEYAHLTDSDIEALAAELDQIRVDIEADRGERDARYVRNTIRLQRGLDRMVKALMQRIPVVRTVYDVAHRLVGLLSTPKDEGLKSMSPVWLYFGGLPAEGEAASSTVVLGLLTTQAPVMLDGQPFHGVLVPTAPVPVGGGLLFVPAAWVVPADMVGRRGG